jgi:hypothetical protein
MTQFYSADVSNQLGISELEQYSIIRMLSKCFWVVGSLQEGGGSVRDTDPFTADHCSSCVATEMESTMVHFGSLNWQDGVQVRSMKCTLEGER